MNIFKLLAEHKYVNFVLEQLERNDYIYPHWMELYTFKRINPTKVRMIVTDKEGKQHAHIIDIFEKQYYCLTKLEFTNEKEKNSFVLELEKFKLLEDPNVKK